MLAQPGIESKYAGEDYRFGFNGQEKDDETYGEGNAIAYEARIYDPRLGRWASIDPARSSYPMHSNYIFAACSPIKYYDKDGRFIGTLIGAVVGGVTAAVRGESVKAGIVSGAVQGAVWDLAVGAVVLTGGAATPLVLAGAGVISGMAGDMVYQGMTTGKIDVNQNIMAGAIGGVTGGLLGATAPKIARWLTKQPKVLIDPITVEVLPETETVPLSSKIARSFDDILEQGTLVKETKKSLIKNSSGSASEAFTEIVTQAGGTTDDIISKDGVSIFTKGKDTFTLRGSSEGSPTISRTTEGNNQQTKIRFDEK